MKKLALVLASTLALACAVVVPAALGSSRDAKSAPAVTLQVKTLSKTLLKKVVHGKKGWITKGGTPRGKCSGNTAAGALDAATHGKWAGKYYASVGGIFVTSIEGVTPKSPHYWGFYVNGKTSNLGVCGVKLRKGERLLFKIV